MVILISLLIIEFNCILNFEGKMKLKKSTLFYYSLAEMPINIALFPIMVFIPKFYTGEMVFLSLLLQILF